MAGPDERSFVHLHLHTEYSLLDGGNRIDKLIARVKELGMDAVGMTDHGNMHGAVPFSQACKDKGIKPILGVEAYIAPGDRHDRTYTGVADGGYHLVLLAENMEGWRNLLYLCSEAYLTGFYFKPRMDRGLLERHSAGLIAINGHLGSEIGEHLLAFEETKDPGHWDKAVESARWHARVFNQGRAPGAPGFYVELQHHVREQNAINPHLIRLAKELDLPLVCDNDAHFLRAEDHDAHDTLICISTGKAKSDGARMKYPSEVYVKSPQEMWELFEPYGEVGIEALRNTARIAERCTVDLPLGANHAPMVRVEVKKGSALPTWDEARFKGDLTAWYGAFCDGFEVRPFKAGEDADEGAGRARAKEECDKALRMLAEAGLVWRYGPDGGPQGSAVRQRLERELAILADKNISAYFLIVWDFVNWGRQQGIPALARGSGVGTMVGYVLGLSNACPVRYGLLFERFTDPDRSEYPDIDIDLCQEGRGRVIDYVRRKYGHVAQIITFGTLKARAAVRDVGRVMEMPLGEVDRIAKLIPEQLGMTLDEALKQEPDLRRLYESEPLVARIIDTARTLEGQARHASVHAAGVIVATRPLHEIVPLYKQTGAAETEVVTQWDGPTCEKVGLLKMDFLGLRTLTTVERCVTLIREGLSDEAIRSATGGRGIAPGAHPLDLERLTYDDQRVFEMFRRGDTTGVFQFESPGMRRLLVDMKPDRLEDLIAANALFRPGPMDLIPDYNRRKHGQDDVPRIHELVDRHTAETYGVMVYQEQVMQIVHELGGISLRDAYTLIKNISKKKHDKIEKERPKFLSGAQKKGLSEKQAADLFELILKFAGYGFNKSHSTGYAIVAYRTAYLKTYFPNQYMAAFLTFESRANKVSDWIPYLEDCKRTRFVNGKVGVEVKAPGINESRADFDVVFEEGEVRDALHGHVRFGLNGIKGVGEKVIDAIVREREGGRGRFTSLFDFCERVLACAPSGSGGAVLNKTTLEALIKSGAMDELHGRDQRAAMCATIEGAVSAAQKAAQDKASGQGGLFGGGGGPGAASSAGTGALARTTSWGEPETLAKEKEALGFYVSSHPLEKWRAWTSVFTTRDATLENVKSLAQDARVVVGALVQSVRTLIVKSGRSAGQKMGVVTFADMGGSVEGVLFSDAFNQYGHLLSEDAVVFVMGRIDRSRAGNAAPTAGADGEAPKREGGGVQLLVDRVVPIDGIPLEGGRLDFYVNLDGLNGTAETVVGTMATLVRAGLAGEKKSEEVSSYPYSVFALKDGWIHEGRPEGALSRIRLDRGMVEGLTSVLGPGCVRLRGGVAVEEAGKNKRWSGGGRTGAKTGALR